MSLSKLVSPSISRVVQEAIDGDLSIQDALQRGYANVSAAARLIKPKVEQLVGSRVTLESVVSAVKRAKLAYKPVVAPIKSVIAESIVNVRTDVAKLSLERSRRVLEAARKMLANYQEEFLQVSESISAVTLIYDQKLHKKIKSFFYRSDVLDEELDLAAVIIHSPPEIVKTPGCLIAFYNQVSRRHINIEDTVSCYTDTILVVRLEDVGRTFAALTDLIASARRGS